MRRTLFFLALAAAVAVAAGATARGASLASTVDPADFGARVDNPWFPLLPGTTFVYTGTENGKPLRDVLRVTHRTATIDGAPCVVIDDRLYVSGRLEERTTDWYSQDSKGNVWYFGEQTASRLDRKGTPVTSGTWKAGVAGAKPGIYMLANPRVGQSAQQEFYKGQAEDHFQVLSLRAAVSVPYVSTKAAMLTKEWTPLEPGVLDHKLYVRGVGTVLEETVKGGTEHLELISVQKGG
jgi:hypothetical protein